MFITQTSAFNSKNTRSVYFSSSRQGFNLPIIASSEDGSLKDKMESDRLPMQQSADVELTDDIAFPPTL